MFKTIDDFPNYEVSDEGIVRHIKNKKVLKERPTNCGCSRVMLYNDKGHKELSIHRLVAKAFIPQNNSSKTDVNHINGNKKDNRVENLEWCTKSENIRHAQDMGLKTYETISTRVLATKDNQTIYFRSYNEAGRFFGVHHETIKQAVAKERNLFGYQWLIAN